MTAALIKSVVLEKYEKKSGLWGNFSFSITSTEQRLYLGWFGILMMPCLLTATCCYLIDFSAAPPVDIDGIREPVAGSIIRYELMAVVRLQVLQKNNL
jgi:hypothetical protein